ncbi:hypothetical protein CXB51_011550 [Gossypium anomalum]|uniref:Uncharacterized protein n=1 Tax=Gossypium anomalum TaxID=47600 RepID=A0A8J6D7L2_9ROSI|nr:hypothetical protein CXB51_011550 [Gossypium anomalum]
MLILSLPTFTNFSFILINLLLLLKYCRFSSVGVLNNFLNQSIWVLRFISGCWIMQPKMQGLQGKVDINHSPKETGTGHQMQNGRCRRQQFPSKHCPDPNLQPSLHSTF